MGTAVANMSNIYFMIALAVYATISAYNFSSFPYDNSCGMPSPREDRCIWPRVFGAAQFLTTFISSALRVELSCR